MQIKTTLKEDLRKKMYLIMYNFSDKTQKHEAFFEGLKKPPFCACSKAREGRVFALTSATDTAQDICNRLHKLMNGSDFLYVCNITKDATGFLDKETITWIQEHYKFL